MGAENRQRDAMGWGVRHPAGGAHAAVDKSFPVNVTGGSVAIQFLPGAANNPKIDAIEIQ